LAPGLGLASGAAIGAVLALVVGIPTVAFGLVIGAALGLIIGAVVEMQQPPGRHH
jgi:hypothetical protein